MAHLDHLYRVALYMAKESNEAKDLVQETYSRALASYRQFTPGSNIKAWLTTILCNFFFHDRNKKKKWLSVEDSFVQDEEPSDYWEEVATENPGPETQMLLKELKGKVTGVLNKIPEEFRLPIILVIMGDFSYEEAAEILSCPVGLWVQSAPGFSAAEDWFTKNLRSTWASKRRAREKNEMRKGRRNYKRPGRQ